ncbi:MAG TPA: sterol desaturase family protein [Candidatus Binatia bacterium]
MGSPAHPLAPADTFDPSAPSASPGRTLLRWLAFPLLLGAPLAAAVVLMPLLGTAPALLLLELLALFAIAAAERAMPYTDTWLRSHGDVATDVAHVAVSGVTVAQLVRPTLDAIAVVVAGWLAALGVGGWVTLWPTSWPLVAQLALALLVAELPQYWLHRLQHEHETLWRFHAVHHSAPRLYFLNAARFHPVDIALLYTVGYVPLIALGCPEQVLALFLLFDGVFGMLQHANLDVRLGPLNRVFSMAEPHRWHHSRELVEANTNYGSNLTVWDVVFGTYYLPPDVSPPTDVGIPDMPRFPSGYLGQLAAPFRWRDVKQRSAGAS